MVAKFSIVINDDLKNKLDKIAELEERKRNYIIKKALDQYVTNYAKENYDFKID